MERETILNCKITSPDCFASSLRSCVVEILFIFLLKIKRLQRVAGKSSSKNYSTFRITGRINWVFTGIPLLIAGFIFGKPTKRALRMLSIFTVS